MAIANNATTSRSPIDDLERRLEAHVDAEGDDEVTTPIERRGPCTI